MLEREIKGQGAGRRYADAAVAYLMTPGTSLNTRAIVKRLNAKVGNPLLAEIDQGAVDRLIARYYPRAAPETILRHVHQPLTSILRHAATLGWCPRPAFKRPKRPPGRMRWLTLAEVNKLVAAASQHLRPLVVFLIYTGARMSEAIELDWNEVDLVGRKVTFLRTKTGKIRSVPLHDQAMVALANLERRSGPVFRRPDGKPYTDRRRLTGGHVRTAWAGACRRAKIADFHPHDCRHTFASWLVMAGTPLRTVAELLGHADLSMVMRYSHLSAEHLRTAISGLPGAETVQAPANEAKNAI